MSLARCFTLVLLLVCLPLVVHSQTSIDTSRSREGRAITVTALRVPMSEQMLPFSVSSAIVTPGTPGLSLKESVVGIPGLTIENRSNFTVGDRITNRGFGARTQFGVRGVRVVADGMPLTFADGQTTLEMIDPQDVASIEL